MTNTQLFMQHGFALHRNGNSNRVLHHFSARKRLTDKLDFCVYLEYEGIALSLGLTPEDPQYGVYLQLWWVDDRWWPGCSHS